MNVDSFFELRIQVFSGETPYFSNGPLRCGPYFSYSEAVRVMMDGLPIVLSSHLENIIHLDEPYVHTKITECAIIDKKTEVLNVKCEEFGSVG